MANYIGAIQDPPRSGVKIGPKLPAAMSDSDFSNAPPHDDRNGCHLEKCQKTQFSQIVSSIQARLKEKMKPSHSFDHIKPSNMHSMNGAVGKRKQWGALQQVADFSICQAN